MRSVLPVIVLLAGMIWALERSHRRQPAPRRPHLGSPAVVDRDAERLRAELRAVAARAPAGRGVDHSGRTSAGAAGARPSGTTSRPAPEARSEWG